MILTLLGLSVSLPSSPLFIVSTQATGAAKIAGGEAMIRAQSTATVLPEAGAAYNK